MIPVFSTSAMRAIDHSTINGDITTGYSLMLEAGMGLFEEAKKMISFRDGASITVFCGKGNNGGDGYVAGKMLLEAGYSVMCYSLCELEALTGEAKIALNEYLARKGNVLVINEVEDIEALSSCDLIIDAILGTGIKGDPHGLCAAVIHRINVSGMPVLSVDTPSGLNCDNGVPGNPCVKAKATVTMGFPKLGLLFAPGKAYVGKLVTKNLGYPEENVVENSESVFCAVAEQMHKILPQRKQFGAKFEHGLALMVCGSRGMSGAATLSSTAAMRIGCGMVHLAIPQSLLDVMSTKVTEPVLHPVSETSSGTPSADSLKEIVNLLKGKNAICIGPGISHHPQTSVMVRELVKGVNVPAVLDADGLNAFVGHTDELKEHGGELLITPHRGEWKRLFGQLSAEPSEIIKKLRAVASDFNLTILLKGNPTIVVENTGKVIIAPFGNSALATAGSGDVLSGIIVSLIAQGASVVDSAILGQFVFGEAGTMAAGDLTEYSVMAGDIPSYIPRIIKRIVESDV